MTCAVLDTSGLTCPLPFLKLRRALRGLAPGASIEVLSTDPLAPADFGELCQTLGHEVVATSLEGAVTRTIIRVKDAPPR